MAVEPPRNLVTVGASIATARRVMVVVHGRDQDAAFMTAEVVDRLHLGDVTYVLPEAPQRRWYPAPFMAPLELNHDELMASLQRLDEIDHWLTGLGRLRNEVVWCGFSQGASLVTTYVAQRGTRGGGLVAFTGALIGPAGAMFSVRGTLDEMPVYLSASADDDWLPVDRARETAEAFRRAGAEVRLDLFTLRGHVISDAEIAAARNMLDR
jgi:phospholipase/carboxylesterase